MDNKQLVLIILAILIGSCIIGGCLYAGINKTETNYSNMTNKTNDANESLANDSNIQNNANTTFADSKEEYTYSPQNDAYVKNSGEDYDTGVVDKNGESIYAYRWVENGVIYETYTSSSGRPVDTNEYYN